MNEVQFSMSESISLFALAFVKAQARMGSAVKGKNNPFFKSKYADLAEVIEVCKDALNNEGIAFLQPVVDTVHQPSWQLPPEVVAIIEKTFPEMSKDDKADALAVIFGSRPRPRIGVCTILLHESGEWLSCTASFPAMKEGPQDYFATTTYLRRACLQAILGIPAEDDDGNAASGRKAAKDEPSSAVMTQDFPPNTPLIGLLKQLIPADGTKPAIAMIEMDGVGTLGFDLLKGEAEYRPLLNRMVEFQYGKNGKFRPITEMSLAPTAVQAPLKAVPGPARTPKAEATSADDTEKKKAAFAAQYSRGLLLEAQTKTGAKGEYHRLKIMTPEEKPIWGSMWHSPGHFGLDSFDELIDQDIYYRYSEGKLDARGNPFINWEEVIPADVFDQYCGEQVAKAQE